MMKLRTTSMKTTSMEEDLKNWINLSIVYYQNTNADFVIGYLLAHSAVLIQKT
jgi:hypothetical protein